MEYVIEPSAETNLAVQGETRTFPVRRIWCVGRNYAEHAREMGHNPDREPPFFFAKPANAAVPGGTLPFPDQTSDLHHEIEMAVLIGKGGRNIPVGQALDHVYGYAIALDMTRRDLQAGFKKLGRPWELAKGFDQSCPISPVVPASVIGHPAAGKIEVKVNGEVRQTGDLSQMIWSVPESISYLSDYVEILAGDIILTGTPAGVGTVKPGDRLHGTCAQVGEIEVVYAG